MVVVEQPLAPREQRATWAEELLEGASASHLHLSRGGVLALYAHARTSGLALDMGWGGTTLTPVADGFPFMMGTQYLPGVGAAAVDAALGSALLAQGVGFAPGAATLTTGAGVTVPPAIPVTALDLTRAVRVPDQLHHAALTLVGMCHTPALPLPAERPCHSPARPCHCLTHTSG